MPRRDFFTESLGNKTDDRGENSPGCSSCHHQGPCEAKDFLGLWGPIGVHQGKSWQPRAPGQLGEHGQPQPQHWAVPWEWPKARPSHGPVNGPAGRDQGQSGQECEEMENSPAVAWPGQKVSPAS